MGTCTCGKKPEEHLSKESLTAHHYWFMHDGIIDGCSICEMKLKDRKPTIPEVLPLIKEYYSEPGNGVGGYLHIVLDDGNIETSSIEFCKQCALEHNDTHGVVIADLLLRMSKTQRKKLYAADKTTAR